MRPLLLVAVIMALPAVAVADEQEEPRRAATAASPAPSLDLGLYGRAASTPETLLLDRGTPRFESTVDVLGHVPPDLNETMATWWRHFDFESSIYGRGYNIQTPVHPGAINLIPLIEWLSKKAKKD